MRDLEEIALAQLLTERLVGEDAAKIDRVRIMYLSGDGPSEITARCGIRCGALRGFERELAKRMEALRRDRREKLAPHGVAERDRRQKQAVRVDEILRAADLPAVQTKIAFPRDVLRARLLNLRTSRVGPVAHRRQVPTIDAPPTDWARERD